MACLGCRVNQAEAASLSATLAAAGWRPAAARETADLVLVMSCAVTASASRQSRQMLGRLARAHPGARLVAVGCDAEVSPEAYRRRGGLALGRRQLAALPALLAGTRAWPPLAGELPAAGAAWCPGEQPPRPGRERALLKVQDGCDAHCAYCIVPRARGKPRSLPLAEAAAAFARLAQAGAAEVVLTGVHLGRYGWDLTPRHELSGLLDALLATAPGPRLRLSSLEVAELTPGLVQRLATEPRLCRHLHLPLQSGCDRVLAAMGRPYRASEFAAAVEEVAARVPGICLGADVVVGLPGEDEAAFAETRDLLARLPLAYLHVFPYSPRPGTPAAELPDRPAPALATRRAAVLRALGQAKRLAFLKSQVGAILEGVVEETGLARADNYCLAELDAAPPAGTMVRFRAVAVLGAGAAARLRGEVAAPPGRL